MRQFGRLFSILSDGAIFMSNYIQNKYYRFIGTVHSFRKGEIILVASIENNVRHLQKDHDKLNRYSANINLIN